MVEPGCRLLQYLFLLVLFLAGSFWSTVLPDRRLSRPLLLAR